MMSINSPPRRFKCQDWFGSSGNPKAADIAVFLACTKRVLQECAQQTRRGDLKCPELEEPLQGEHIGLQWCHSQPWVHRHYTRTVHLPVSKPMEERKMQFGLDVVIDDHEYLKPTPVMTLTGWNPDKTKQIICNPTVRRTNTFLYIARIGSDQKGHISFLERIDPGLLERYRIVFFSGLNSTVSQKTKDQMMEIALRRGIDIEVHLDRVPIETLLETACLSLGLIEYSKRDQNPRYGGMKG